jgi:hypothetical protein
MDIAEVCTVDYFAFQRDRYGKQLERLRVSEPMTSAAGRSDFEIKFRKYFNNNQNVVFIETQDLLKNPDGSVKWWDGHGALYYIDTNHLSPFGAKLFVPRIAKALSASEN